MWKHRILFSLLFVFYSCQNRPQQTRAVDDTPLIYPDYRSVTVPVNVAPLNFGMDSIEAIFVDFKKGEQILLTCSGKRQIDIPQSEWGKMLGQTAGGKISVAVQAKKNGEWISFRPFEIEVAADSIDAYLAYRLIEPNYGMWNQLGIYQRDLSTFHESTILHNSLVGDGCINCHTFDQYSPQRFMLHVRNKDGGTVLVDGQTVTKVDLRNDKTGRAATYPMWHPGGNYIVFSSNDTRQAFHAFQKKRVEVYDTSSDLMLYDIQNNRVSTDPRFVGDDYFETFPTWSPDGKWLYFCRSQAVDSLPDKYDDLKYRLMRVGFDPETGRFAAGIDSLVMTGEENMSISFPRISPDGRYLLYTLANDATFPIWHEEADLKMVDLDTFLPVDISPVNSPAAESYHSWSSNGRWIVFGSRRDRGLYTCPYIAYFGADGKMGRPFLLPQQDFEHYRKMTKSYNIPEFIRGEVTLSPYELADGINGPRITPKPF